MVVANAVFTVFVLPAREEMSVFFVANPKLYLFSFLQPFSVCYNFMDLVTLYDKGLVNLLETALETKYWTELKGNLSCCPRVNY